MSAVATGGSVRSAPPVYTKITTWANSKVRDPAVHRTGGDRVVLRGPEAAN